MPSKDYEAHKERTAQRSREQAAAGTDIGDIPRCKNRKRRARCKDSLRKFCLSYFSEKFYLGFSPSHDRLIAKLEAAVKGDQLLSLAMPRGSGKTTLCEIAAMWAIFYGHKKFLVLIGADKEAAEQLLNTIIVAIETNDAIANDFPEICYPIQQIERTASRCKKQTCNGRHTRITYSDDKLVLPSIANSPASGSVIVARGILGRIRGMKHAKDDGEDIRPDLVIVDDPQTEESSQSPRMCRKRVKVLTGGILGLAGPGKSLAGMMPCTVLEPGDMADQLLDRSQYPQWQGERVAFVTSWPKHQELWDRYMEILREDLEFERGYENANAFYAANRRKMDAGYKVYWDNRFDEKKGETSAKQHFWNKVVELGPEKAASELQNDPTCKKLIRTCVEFEWHVPATTIIRKVSGYAAGVVPDNATKITGMIDLHLDVLYYGLVAWTPSFTGWVIDYGWWPEKNPRYFEKSSARHTMSAKYREAAKQSDAAMLHEALGELTEMVIGRKYRRVDGTMQKVDLCMIDANYGPETDTVYEFCELSPLSDKLMPSHGMAVGINRPPLHARPQGRGEIVGHHWRMPSLAKTTKKVRYINFDPNPWKVFVFQRLAAARGTTGCLELPGRDSARDADDHLMLADHLHSELPEKASGTYGDRVLFAEPPPGVDNHLFDVMVGCCVGASQQGCKLPGVAMNRRGGRKNRSGKRKRLSQM